MEIIKDAAQLRSRAMEILIREMGYVNAMRFMLLYETGCGDYTKERQRLFKDWTVDDITREADKLVAEREKRS